MSQNETKERTYHRTADVVGALRIYSERSISATDKAIAQYLAEYFARLDDPVEEEFPDIYNICAHLPILLSRALEDFYSSTADWIVFHRKQFLVAANRKELTAHSDIFTEDASVENTLTRYNFCCTMREAMPERKIDYSLLEGAYSALRLYFDRFLEKVYIGQKMHERIMNATLKGIGGTFGQTDLLTFDMAGRIMFTFKRGESDVSFVKTSNDPLALSAGIWSCNADLITALTMIQDVTENYRPEAFVEDKNINLGF